MNLRHRLAWDLGKWFVEMLSCKPVLKSLKGMCRIDFKGQLVPDLRCR